MRAILLPSGLNSGARSKVFKESFPNGCLPRSCGKVRVFALGSSWVLIEAIHSFESESVVIPSTARTAGSSPDRSEAR